MTGIPLQGLLIGDVRPLGPRGILSGSPRPVSIGHCLSARSVLPVTRKATQSTTEVPKRPSIIMHSITIRTGRPRSASALCSERRVDSAKICPHWA